MVESNDHEITSSEADQSHTNITIIEQEILELQIWYIQKQQWLQQQKFILIIKDIFNVSNKMPSCKKGQPHVPCQYCGSAEH